MSSRYELDCQEISRIQFHTDLTQEQKNDLISKIERKMDIEEQKELDGKGDGYYA
jgi:hypothetical protein